MYLFGLLISKKGLEVTFPHAPHAALVIEEIQFQQPRKKKYIFGGVRSTVQVQYSPLYRLAEVPTAVT